MKAVQVVSGGPARPRRLLSMWWVTLLPACLLPAQQSKVQRSPGGKLAVISLISPMPRQSLDYVIERNVSFGDLQFSSVIGLTQLHFLSFITLWNIKTNLLLLTFIILQGDYRGRFSQLLYTADTLCSWRALGSFPAKDLSWTCSTPGGLCLQWFWSWCFSP